MTTHKDDHLMSIERLRTWVSIYGADLDRLSTTERAEAEALLESSDEARAVWNEALGLDCLLADEKRPPPSQRLLEALKELPTQHEQISRASRGHIEAPGSARERSNVVWFSRRSQGWASLAAAAALALGVISGTREQDATTWDEPEVTAVGEGGGDAELDELDALAFGGELLTDLEMEGAAE
jgi:hypothetical protein